MRHEHDRARHFAEQTIAMANADLANPRIANNARRRQTLTDMKERAMRTVEHHNRMYGDRSERFNSDDRYNDTVDRTMDAISKILPHITGDDMDVEDAVRVRGYTRRGRGGRRVRVPGYTRRNPSYRADADDWDDDYGDDYSDVENARRGRGRKRDRYGRFTSDMDDMAMAVADAAAETARRIHSDRTRSDVYPPHPIVNPRHDRNDTQDTGTPRR